MLRRGFQRDWACEACTYENCASSIACSMCDTINSMGTFDDVSTETYVSHSFSEDERNFGDTESSSFSVRNASINLDNISLGILLGSIGGAGLAALRGKNLATGALYGAGYGAMGGILMNESDFLNSEIRESLIGAEADNHRHRISQEYLSHRHDFLAGQLMQGANIDDFMPDDDISTSDFDDEMTAVDIDMSYENLISLFGDGSQQRAAPETSISDLPTFHFTAPGKIATDDILDPKYTCPICMEPYILREEICTLPCLHIFHDICVKKWLRQSNNCPICKVSL